MRAGTHGFTMVELLVATLASAILALTAGLMLVISYSAWIANRDYVDLQRDISLTQTIVDRWVREASHWEVTSTNNGLLIATSSGPRRLYAESGSLIFDPDTGTPGDELIVSSNRVTDFSVEATPRGVVLDLQLEEDPVVGELHTFISHRN